MSEGSESSQIRRFGLYRSIDAKTEEFLRLSRKRQMRQGCACAAISTTITVTVVIIVLLIYEYMIAVETSFVQGKRSKIKEITKDIPVADKLDRNFLGVDQDYYERMPLLINALQEISFTDSETRSRTPRRQHFSKYYTTRPRTTTTASRFIKRTSPRPFFFEYRSPYPMPFSKASGNPNYWEEQYRNAQRLKNLHDVVKYLEKTLNAKFGDIILPSRAQVALSGVYIAPVGHTSVEGVHTFGRGEKKSNHFSDPLHIFRPESPGEINLLADGLRFAPTFLSKIEEEKPGVRHSNFQRQSCIGNQCLFINKKTFTNTDLSSSEEVKSSTIENYKKKYNIFSSENSNSQEIDYSKNELDKIYITTSRPVFQFKRKSTIPLRRFSYKKRVRPKISGGRKKQNFINPLNSNENASSHIYYTTSKNFGNKINVTESVNNYFDTTTITSNDNINVDNTHVINYPKLNYKDIEDYHMGSSGIVPMEERTTSSFIPIVTTNIPLSNPYNIEAATTNPPEIFKFSPEDAKVPDHYYNIRKSDIVDVTESFVNQLTNSEQLSFSETVQNDEDHEANTLIVKLRNLVESTSKANEADEITSTESLDKFEEDIETTTGTYVPQINGHNRYVKHKNLIALLEENSEKYRKKRIESLVTIRNPTYVPMYVEIRRNKNTIVSDQTD